MSLNPYGVLAAAVGAFAAGWYAGKPKNIMNSQIQTPPTIGPNRSDRSTVSSSTENDKPYFEAPLTTHPSFPYSQRRMVTPNETNGNEISSTEPTNNQTLQGSIKPPSGTPSSELGLTGLPGISNFPHTNTSSHFPPYDHSHPWFEQEEENITFEDALEASSRNVENSGYSANHHRRPI